MVNDYFRINGFEPGGSSRKPEESEADSQRENSVWEGRWDAVPGRVPSRGKATEVLKILW